MGLSQLDTHLYLSRRDKRIESKVVSISYAELLDFELAEYRIGSTSYPNFGSVPGSAYTRNGPCGEQMRDKSVKTFAINELPITDEGLWIREGKVNDILNSGESQLVTRTITRAADNHTFSFIGSGSVAISGAVTANLAGTGPQDRVKIKVTNAASGNFTFTPTGDVRWASFVTGSEEGPLVPTTGVNASSGNGIATLTKTIPNEDYLIFGALRYKAIPSTDQHFDHLLTMRGATDADWCYLGRSTTGILNAQDSVQGAFHTNVNASAGGRAVMAIQRTAGKFRSVVRYNGLTTFSAETAVGTKSFESIRIGSWVTPNHYAEAPIEFIARRLGTFTNAEVIDILAAA